MQLVTKKADKALEKDKQRHTGEYGSIHQKRRIKS